MDFEKSINSFGIKVGHLIIHETIMFCFGSFLITFRHYYY